MLFWNFDIFSSFQFPCLNILFLKIFILLPDLIFLTSFKLILFLYKHLVPTINIGVIPRFRFRGLYPSPSIHFTLISLVLYNTALHRCRCCLFRLWLRLWLIRLFATFNIIHIKSKLYYRHQYNHIQIVRLTLRCVFSSSFSSCYCVLYMRLCWGVANKFFRFEACISFIRLLR